MSKLKGLNKLTREINKFTQKEFGVTCRFGKEFEAFASKKLVHYAILIDIDLQDTFFADVHRRFEDIEASDFIWLLMHEIGHCQTDYMWDNEDEVFFARQKKTMDKTAIKDDVIAKNEWYHSIPDEYFATKWAGEYMRENPIKVKKFNKKFNKAFEEFIEKNEIEVDN